MAYFRSYLTFLGILMILGSLWCPPVQGSEDIVTKPSNLKAKGSSNMAESSVGNNRNLIFSGGFNIFEFILSFFASFSPPSPPQATPPTPTPPTPTPPTPTPPTYTLTYAPTKSPTAYYYTPTYRK